MNRTGIEEMERMISRKELSKLIDVPASTLGRWANNWELTRMGPRPTKLGGTMQSRVRYRESDVIKWQKSLTAAEEVSAQLIEAEYERQKTA